MAPQRIASSRYIIRLEKQRDYFCKSMCILLEKQLFTDLTIICNTYMIKIHKCVLAANSPYFMERLREEFDQVIFHSIKPLVLKAMIEFIYCGETSVTKDDLPQLIGAGNYFGIKGITTINLKKLDLEMEEMTDIQAPYFVNKEGKFKQYENNRILNTNVKQEKGTNMPKKKGAIDHDVARELANFVTLKQCILPNEINQYSAPIQTQNLNMNTNQDNSSYALIRNNLYKYENLQTDNYLNLPVESQDVIKHEILTEEPNMNYSDAVNSSSFKDENELTSSPPLVIWKDRGSVEGNELGFGQVPTAEAVTLGCDSTNYMLNYVDNVVEVIAPDSNYACNTTPVILRPLPTPQENKSEIETQNQQFAVNYITSVNNQIPPDMNGTVLMTFKYPNDTNQNEGQNVYMLNNIEENSQLINFNNVNILTDSGVNSEKQI